MKILEGTPGARGRGPIRAYPIIPDQAASPARRWILGPSLFSGLEGLNRKVCWHLDLSHVFILTPLFRLSSPLRLISLWPA